MPTQEQVSKFLDQLREYGKINMLGAAPYVAKAFNISVKDAQKMTVTWMEKFSD